MKKYFPFYLCSLLVFFSPTAQAMESAAEERKVQALQEIVTNVLPLASYEASKDRKGDQERLIAAESSKQEEGQIIFRITLDNFLHNIFPFLDEKSFRFGMKLTCRFFYELSHLSLFFLNEYCLTETRPHAMSREVLCSKTHNTKDGIFKLAALMSVSATDLKNWFEPNFLQAAFLPHQDSLPEQLEGQSEEDLDKLYPILKVALASLVDTADTSNPVIKLLQEYPYPYGLSLNKMRLLSLNPTHPGVYHETLEQLVVGQRAYPASASQVRETIARELLMVGKSVANINSSFFVYCNPPNPQKREVANQILELCVHTPQFYQDYNCPQLIKDAFYLGRPDLAFQVLRKVVGLPNDANSLPYKIFSFLNYKDREIDDKQVETQAQEFLTNLYSFWGQLPAYIKFPALSLLMQAGGQDEVQRAMNDIMLQPEEEVLIVFESSIFSDFCDYDYPEEAKKLIHYLLNVATDKIITMLSKCYKNKDDIFTQFIKVDREKSIVLLKAFVESDQVNIRDKIETLTFLTKHAIIEEIDQEKSVSLLKSFIESEQASIGDRVDAHIFLAKHAVEERDREKSISSIKDFVKSGQIDIDAEINALWFLVQHATRKIDREESIARLKGLIETDQLNLDTKVGLLLFLARHAIEEKDYVMSQIKCLNYEKTNRSNADQVLCFMYYSLKDQASCNFYYQNFIQKMLKRTDQNSIKRHAKRLKKLQEGGLKVERIEDLLNCDPFKVIGILSVKKD